MKNYLIGIIIFLIIGMQIACRKDKPSAKNQTVSVSKSSVYITNEGNFQFGNASVSLFDEVNKTVTDDLFKPANSRPLGDVCQSLFFFNNNCYVVLNNSAKIEVVNATTFVASNTINGFNSPRYFLPVSNQKAYVSDLYANKIWVVDLVANKISNSINCVGWTEQMLSLYGHVYVANRSTDKVYVLNIVLDKIIDSIKVGYGPNSIKQDKNGNLWVLCNGDASKNKLASLHQINPINNTVIKSLAFTDSNDLPTRLNFNSTNDTLFYLNKNIYQLSINAAQLPNSAIISQGGSNFYSLAINPNNNIIYVSDAIDYVQKGTIYRYLSNGVLIDNFKAGIIPGDFYFH
ncbi:MAG: hypothetical protein RIQ33_1972 [Bacteroidota bacterium]|jgi:YVTN family beta-propeller protein